MRNQDANSEYVQYGCGHCAPADWTNFDASLTLIFERIPIIGSLYTKNPTSFPRGVRYGNIIKGLPVADNSCQAVYCSHVLEHLALQDFRRAVRNTYRMMKKGGCFRLVIPDLAREIDIYCKNPNPDASIAFLNSTGLGLDTRPRGFEAFALFCLGNSRHLWMWDYKSISKELENAGFVNVRRAQMGDAEDPKFQQVEELSRWKDCLGIDCRK